jgi:hypothetical protein
MTSSMTRGWPCSSSNWQRRLLPPLLRQWRRGAIYCTHFSSFERQNFRENDGWGSSSGWYSAGIGSGGYGTTSSGRKTPAKPTMASGAGSQAPSHHSDPAVK